MGLTWKFYEASAWLDDPHPLLAAMELRR